MKKVLVIGASSYLSQSLASKLGHCDVSFIGRKTPEKLDALNLSSEYIKETISLNKDVYIFNLGLIQPKTIFEQSSEEIERSMRINLLFVVKSSEYILDNNSKAKVLIIGSESGKKGSYDTTYFLAKAGLRAYVKERYLSSPYQQLLLFSPSTIGDSAMTLGRHDKERLNEYMLNHPKKRFLCNDELASIMSQFINDEFSYVTNTEIEINGGKFARMKY